MNLALLIKQATIKHWFIKQVAYYANGWYTFEQETFNEVDGCSARLVIIAKCHYDEKWQSYPSVSKKELQQIIQLQKDTGNSASVTFQIFVNQSIDGFDVKRTRIDQALINILGENKILLPETALFSSEEQSVLSLQTPVGHLFVSSFNNRTMSSYEKGLVSNIETFKLTVGLASEVTETVIKSEGFGNYIFKQLITHPLDSLFSKMAFNLKNWFESKNLHLLYWTPLATALCFFIISNGYLWFKGNAIENNLNAQSSRISELLIQKLSQDKKKHLLNLLNEEFSKTDTVHEHWSLVYDLVESGMIITRLSFKNNSISIKGQAEKASLVLANIASNKNVVSASFKGAVRKTKKLESFTLELVPLKTLPSVVPNLAKKNLLDKSVESEQR